MSNSNRYYSYVSQYVPISARSKLIETQSERERRGSNRTAKSKSNSFVLFTCFPQSQKLEISQHPKTGRVLLPRRRIPCVC